MAERNCFVLHSLNPLYQPYPKAVNEVREIWKYSMHMTNVFPDAEPSMELVLSELRQLKKGQEQILERVR